MRRQRRRYQSGKKLWRKITNIEVEFNQPPLCLFREFAECPPNPNSLEVVNAKCEPALAKARPEKRYQFERLGYFTLDLNSTSQKQIWNRTVTLRDAWAREAKGSVRSH